MQFTSSLPLSLLCVIIHLPLAACSGGGGGSSSPPTVDVTGSWMETNDPGSEASFTLVQVGASVTGSGFEPDFVTNQPPCVLSGFFDISATVSGNQGNAIVTLTNGPGGAPEGVIVQYTLTVTGTDDDILTGTGVVTSVPAGCVADPDPIQLTAIKVSPLQQGPVIELDRELDLPEFRLYILEGNTTPQAQGILWEGRWIETMPHLEGPQPLVNADSGRR